MNTDAIQKTKDFVKNAFIANPHYSFNHWSVMYDHSIIVQELAIQIARETTYDLTIVAISSLLHDIGKTYHTSSETLLKEHQNFNVIVSNDFLKSLHLDNNTYQEICNIISYQSDSEEMKIVKDADAIALYSDTMLYMLLIQWIYNNELEHEITRKLEKYNNLYFEISKHLGAPKLEQMKHDWEEYKVKIIKR